MRETFLTDGLRVGDPAVLAVCALRAGVGIVIVRATVHESKVMEPRGLDACMRSERDCRARDLKLGLDEVGRKGVAVGFGDAGFSLDKRKCTVCYLSTSGKEFREDVEVGADLHREYAVLGLDSGNELTGRVPPILGGV
jgi:hypothetical protein